VGTGAWACCDMGTGALLMGTGQGREPGRKQTRQGRGNLPSSRPVFAAIRAARLLVRTVATLGRGRSRDKWGASGEQSTLKRSSGALAGREGREV
jgi:hypothetical protein